MGLLGRDTYFNFGKRTQTKDILKMIRIHIPFLAFWLRSNVIFVLISLIFDMWTNGSHNIKLIF